MKKEVSSHKLERDDKASAALNAHAAANYLAVNIETLDRMARAGELTHTRVGRSLRFRHVDLDRYLEEQTSTYWKRMDGRGRPAKTGKARGGQ